MDQEIPATLSDVATESIGNCGTAFASGTFAGCVYYSGVGAYLAPKGQRIFFALKHVRDRATLLGGSIALWSAIFHTSKGGLTWARGKDDPYNASAGGFLVGLVSNYRVGLSNGIREGLRIGMLCYVIYTLSDRTTKNYQKRTEEEFLAKMKEAFEKNPKGYQYKVMTDEKFAKSHRLAKEI